MEEQDKIHLAESLKGISESVKGINNISVLVEIKNVLDIASGLLNDRIVELEKLK